jgi:hypothetical protein
VSDLLVTGEFHAAPQRWATGMEIPKDEQGRPLPVFEKLINRFWVSESTDTTFGQFTQADLSGFREVIDMFISHLAS